MAPPNRKSGPPRGPQPPGASSWGKGAPKKKTAAGAESKRSRPAGSARPPPQAKPKPAPRQPPRPLAEAPRPPRVSTVSTAAAPKRRAAAAGPHRAGFALLLGRPNVGKSTLLNRLVGEHLAIVSPRPQTTRQRLLGVVNRPGTQLCLLDSPGVHRAQGLLHKAMVEQALSSISEVDVVVYMAEAGWPLEAMEGKVDPATVDPVGAFHRDLLGKVVTAGKPVVLVLTKIDLIPRPLLLPLMQKWAEVIPGQPIYPLSALTGENVEGIVEVVRPFLPEGEPLFGADVLTDQTERALCAEFIREQVFLQTHEEVPYGAAVVIEVFDESERGSADEEESAPQTAAPASAVAKAVPSTPVETRTDDDESAFDDVEWPEGWRDGDDFVEALAVGGGEDDEEDEGEELESAALAEAETSGTEPELKPGLVRLAATIIVERPPHKGIVIGRGGQRLKEIGRRARRNIERLLGCRVWLDLHVRVIPGWTEKRPVLHDIGLA